MERTNQKRPKSKKEDQKKDRIQTKEKKELEARFSDFSNCQLIVNPKGRKYAINKSQTVPEVLIAITGLAIEHVSSNDPTKSLLDELANIEPKEVKTKEKLLIDKGIVTHGKLQHENNSPVVVVAIEMAGVGYKINQTMGSVTDYMRSFEQKNINDTMMRHPKTRTIVAVEEKRSFSPNIMKGPTCQERSNPKKGSHPIGHLRMLSQVLKNFTRSGVLATNETKTFLSTYIPSHIQYLNIKHILKLIFDSEFRVSLCSCGQLPENCICFDVGAIPLECNFNTDGLIESHLQDDVRQRRGEGELAVVDWIVNMEDELNPGEAILGIMTSGDIDGVVALMKENSIYTNNYLKWNILFIIP